MIMARVPRTSVRAQAEAALAPPLSMTELEALLRDPNVPESQLRPYFAADPSASRAFAPAIDVNPAKVTLSPAETFRLEAAFAFDWANSVCRWRRQARFDLRKTGENLPIIVSEGDSWFEFPIFIDDV